MVKIKINKASSQEKAVRKAVKTNWLNDLNGKNEPKAKDFIVRRNVDKKWEIEFTYMNSEGKKLKAKNNEVRQFLRISGVQSWMEKSGLKDFKVML
jgi:hypothetical protein